ncbi:SSI family serine proteinase inhibitor [Symbioplanes lichenis]|uniref:SSI family serine proteinase inhibitor n=1 Tax=Symbioplanes lichenis TaxID=1629072 RepID=UPI002739DB35|nr:SSI family serine proteinase inhibitor [Actinoplanes lichenis]
MIRSLSLSAVLLALAASPAAAAKAGESRLELSYTAAAGYAGAVELRCKPAAGAHPRKKTACQELTAAKGNPAKLKPRAGMCTMQYDPVTATVRGTWRGGQVAWSKTFGNACAMRLAMGDVMAF